jgi:dolichol kinase
MMNEKSEIKRQLFHIIVGILVVLSMAFVSRRIVLASLLSLLLVSVLFSIISVKKRIPVISFLLDKMGRSADERFPGKGFIFFIAGCLLAFKIFPQDIALASIAVLTFGDSVSTLAGSINRLGKKYRAEPFSRCKAYYGTIIGAIVAFPFAMIFVSPLYAAAAAAAGMLAEAVSIKFGEQEADDNLMVPLAAGTACYLLKLIG